MTFGERLKELRKKRGLTQKELAQLISAKNNSVSNWENDQNIPTASVVFSLARALNVTVEDLIGHYSMDEVIAIGEKPFDERTRYEKLVYNVFHEYSSDIGRGLKAAGGSFESFAQILDNILTEQAENDTSIDPERAESLRNELRGIMSGYNSLTDEGKEFVSCFAVNAAPLWLEKAAQARRARSIITMPASRRSVKRPATKVT